MTSFFIYLQRSVINIIKPNMNPFIYNFLEDRKRESSNVNLLEYSNDLNLTVVKGTKNPAIDFNSLGTQTFTKANGESTDADQDWIGLSQNISLGTGTQTRQQMESGDSDHHQQLIALMGTQTVTLVNTEGFDTDYHNSIKQMMATQTITESRRETSDSNR
jgi:hypothetical protein